MVSDSSIPETGKFPDIHVENKANDGFLNLDEAYAAESADQQEGFFEALKNHKSAVFWSIMVSMCVVMEAYDIALVSNLVALPAFRKRFGVYVDASSGYQLDAAWQSALLQSPIIGAFFGVLAAGQTTTRFGYKKTLLANLVLMISTIFITFFATSLKVLLVGQLLSGLPWGAFAILGPSFASEIAPVALRGFLTTYIQVCWCIGQFICSGVLLGVEKMDTEWAYRIPFAIQWVFPAPLLVILAFGPESPWFLVRKQKFAEAEAVIKRLQSGSGTGKSPAETLSYMIRTTRIEAEHTAGASYADCLKGADLRRTIICCGIHAACNYSGLLLGNLSTYFFTVAGFDSNRAYQLGLITTGAQLGAVILSWVVSQHVGHRTLYLYGTGINVVLLFIIGILACVPASPALQYASGSLVIIMAAQCGISVLPMTWAQVSESSSLRLRAQTIGLSRDFYYIIAITMGILNSYCLSPTGFNLIGKTGFVWGSTAAIVWIICYFGLPEMRHRSWRELDIMFHRGIPARDFSKTVIGLEEEK
ncbi:general substrate transporter [Meredithblackwellia eburnea MCA 4105]